MSLTYTLLFLFFTSVDGDGFVLRADYGLTEQECHQAQAIAQVSRPSDRYMAICVSDFNGQSL